MNVTVITPDELGEAELTAWRAMQEATPALDSPFLSPEFTQAVGHQRPGARVAVLSDGQRLLGFFPFERHRFGLGLPIGSGMCDCQGLIHVPELDWDPMELLRSCGLRLWRYDHLAEDQTPFETEVVDRAGSPVIDLRQGYDAYVAALRARSTRRAKHLRQDERLLARRVGEVRFAFHDTDPESLDALMRHKSAHYRAKEQVDLFNQPRATALVRELHRARGATCTGVVSVLYAGGRPVAWLFGLRSLRVLHIWFSAYDPDVGQFSPGILVRLKAAESAAAEGLDRIDLGKGREPYKEAMKSSELPRSEGWVDLRTIPATVRRTQVEAVTRVRGAVAGNPVLRRAALNTLNAIPRLGHAV
ncbi:GNAT family N-acetyltransferase [Streptomyces sp. NPDC048604]|uniref:GNAT family N-acetyltransferase n=1 Tax=Streptomyces sp. NPDC048604 TaxID=3365578 RepID=UPI003710515A